jgi:hypothetical protein
LAQVETLASKARTNLPAHTCSVKFWGVSTTALHVIELVKSLSETDQQAIRDALASPKLSPEPGQRRKLQRLPDGSYFNPDGIPNDDPVFKVLEEIEDERHRTPGPSSPKFD